MNNRKEFGEGAGGYSMSDFLFLAPLSNIFIT